MMRITETVKQLIIINIIFFIGTQIIGAEVAYKFLAMHFPVNSDFKVWQILTSMFMHGSIGHILFNMLGLWMFGSPLEQMWGPKKFLFFYISCGLGAALLSIGIDYYLFYDGVNTLIENGFGKTEIISLLAEGKIDTRWEDFLGALKYQNMMQAYFGSSLGASGAIYGILVVYAFLFPNAEIRMLFMPFIPIKAKYFILGILIMDMYSGLRGHSVLGAGDGIGHFAHLGGALIGVLIMWYWKKNQFNNNRWN